MSSRMTIGDKRCKITALLMCAGPGQQNYRPSVMKTPGRSIYRCGRRPARPLKKPRPGILEDAGAAQVGAAAVRRPR